MRSVVDPLKLKAPVFGSLFAKVAVARFTRNFSAMIAAGVPILQSLALSARHPATGSSRGPEEGAGVCSDR